MDIGGHRFFSKSDRVMEWWVELMPPSWRAGRLRECGRDVEPAVEIGYQGKRRVVTVPAHLHEESPLRGMGPLHHEEREEAEEEDSEETLPRRCGSRA